MRDWSSTLWSASVDGIPFWISRDHEDGGRRLGVHEYPGRDDPFVEDMGAAKRTYGIDGYVASDAADSEIGALMARLAGGGIHILVLPITGPVSVRCEKVSRAHALDRLGYVAFTASFIRVGSPADPVTAASLAQIVFDTVDGLGAVLDGLAGSLSLVDTIDFVAAAVDDGLVDITAGLSLVVDVVIDDISLSRAAGDALSVIVAAIDAGAVVGSAALDAATSALGLAGSLAGTSSIRSLWTLARTIGDVAIAADAASGPGRVVEAFDGWISSDPDDVPMTSATPSRAAIARNAVLVDVMARVIGFGATIEAVVRTTYGSRDDGLAARSAIVAAADRILSALSVIGPADASAPSEAVAAARGATVEWIVRAVADLAPVRTVRTAVELPATVLAWTLYGDPMRGAELVARNRVAHPALMPTRFEALTS